MLQLLFPALGKRSEFNKRAKGRFAMAMFEMTVAAMWSLAGALMPLHSPWAVLPPLIVALPVVLRLRKRLAAPVPLRPRIAASAACPQPRGRNVGAAAPQSASIRTA